jgi:hypothetical protein
VCLTEPGTSEPLIGDLSKWTGKYAISKPQTVKNQLNKHRKCISHAKPEIEISPIAEDSISSLSTPKGENPSPTTIHNNSVAQKVPQMNLSKQNF